MLKDKISTLELLLESKRSFSFLEKEKEKPVLLRELSPLVVSVGGSATFSVRASSFPEATVQWLHEGQEITSSSTFTFRRDTNEFSLVISPVQRELAGEYSCTLRNSLGQSTSTSYLYVSEPDAEGSTFKPPGKAPHFNKAIESLQVSEGDQAFFSYTVSGEPLPHIQWIRGSCHIPPSGFCVTVNRPDGSGFINIQGVRQEHSGVYTCKACNQYGEASCSAKLLVSRQEVKEEPSVPEESPILTSRSVQKESEQMKCTLSGEQPQLVPSEEVQVLPDVHLSSAHLHREQINCQNTPSEVEERVPSHAPPQVVQVNAVKQHHMTSFVSTVQETPKIAEQHLQCILSPELLQANMAEEQSSKLCVALCKENQAFSTVRADAQTDVAGPEYGHSGTEHRPPVSCHQVDNSLLIHAEIIGVASPSRPKDERSVRVMEGLKLLNLAQSTDHLPPTAEHFEPVPAVEPPIQPSSWQEEAEKVVAAVSQSSIALSKEQVVKEQKPAWKNISPHKYFVCQSAATADERYLLQGEEAGQVPALVPPVSVQPQREGEQYLNLQMITDQDVLLSEGRFSGKTVSVLQDRTRRSHSLLHLVTQENLQTVICEATSELPATTDCTSVQPKKESQQTSLLQSVLSPLVLPKEDVLAVFVPDRQVAAFKQENVRRHAATSEDRWSIGADHYEPLNMLMDQQECRSSIKPSPLKVLSVSCENTQLTKETPFNSEAKQQRTLIQTQDYWNMLHAADVRETRTMEEGHALSLRPVEFSSLELKTEPKGAKRIMFLKDTALSIENCVDLPAAQQDVAIQIKEGQAVRQSVSLEEKRVISGEWSCDIQKWDSSTVKVVLQPRELLFVHVSRETQTVAKELRFVIKAPKECNPKVGPQRRAALLLAVATDQEVLLVDSLGRLEEAKVEKSKILREDKGAIHTYLVSATGTAMEIALSFEGYYPQTANLRIYNKVPLHTMLSNDQQSLLLEEPSELPTERPQRALACWELIRGVISPVVDVLIVVESLAALLPSPSCHTANVRAEGSASFHTVTVHSLVEVHKSVEACRKSKAKVNDRDYEALMTSTSSGSQLDFPVFTDFLQDHNVEQNGKAVLSATVSNACRVDWFFSGQLIESGTEFKCMRDQDRYTLVIDQVLLKHQGEFVCQAKNEAGTTATSFRLSLVSRGLMMFFCHRHLTSHDLCGVICRPQLEPSIKTFALFEVSAHLNIFSSIPSLQYHLYTFPLLPLSKCLPIINYPSTRSLLHFSLHASSRFTDRLSSQHLLNSRFLHSLTLCDDHTFPSPPP